MFQNNQIPTFFIFYLINPLTSPGEGVTVFTSPYLSAGAPTQGEAKGLILSKSVRILPYILIFQN